MTTQIQITARDPVVSRDGRPFGAGQGRRMRSTGWPLPGVVAGSFRTALAKAAEQDFTGTVPDDLLKKVAVHGLFPVLKDGELYLPAPADALHDEKNDTPLRSLPRDLRSTEEGCDWPGGADLRPVMPKLDDKDDDFKPAKGSPAFWPLSAYTKWLTEKDATDVTFDNTFLLSPEAESRDHVAMDDSTGAAADSLLFATTALPLTHLRRFGVDRKKPFAERYAEVTLSTRVTIDPPLPWATAALATLNMAHPLGGERRLVGWEKASVGDWNCPARVTAALRTAKKVSMTLATPAVFNGGWKPGWLDMTGSPFPGGPRLTLVGVCINRWKAVSGWSLAPPRGPKAIKRYVPAGGVYFFKVADGDEAAELAKHWLEPVSDDPQDRRDGFGLAVWGAW